MHYGHELSQVDCENVSVVNRLAAGDTLVIKVALATITFDANDSWSVAFLG